MFEMTMRKDIIDRAKRTAGVVDSAAAAEMKVAGGGQYSWRDAPAEVYLEVNCPVADDSTVSCTIASDSLKVKQSTGEMLLEGNLFQSVDAAKSKWEVKDSGAQRKLAITLSKETPMRWLMVVR
jgi:hypothetical protein